MSFRISELACDYYTLKTKMQRARHLYVLFCHKQIKAEGTTALQRCARKLMFSGLKRTPYIADAQYTVLRHMYFIDIGRPYTNGKDNDPMGWHRWLKDNCFKHATGRGVHWIKYDKAV
jgi:hypothetical protein